MYRDSDRENYKVFVSPGGSEEATYNRTFGRIRNLLFPRRKKGVNQGVIRQIMISDEDCRCVS
jgi:hypothetical protein